MGSDGFIYLLNVFVMMTVCDPVSVVLQRTHSLVLRTGVELLWWSSGPQCFHAGPVLLDP